MEVGGGLPDVGHQMQEYAMEHAGEWAQGAIDFGAGFIHGFVDSF